MPKDTQIWFVRWYPKPRSQRNLQEIRGSQSACDVVFDMLDERREHDEIGEVWMNKVSEKDRS